jgi:dihydroxyacid dehydratase/phosphogluconate dehydratase
MTERKKRMRSDLLKKGPSCAPARATAKGAGFNDSDLEKPVLVGVANTWTLTRPSEDAEAGGQSHG